MQGQGQGQGQGQKPKHTKTFLDKALLKEAALEIGFSDIGFAKTEPLNSELPYLNTYLSKLFHANMHFLERDVEKRINPTSIFPETHSVLVAALSYFPDAKNSAHYNPLISKYAQGKDYHKLIKKMLRSLEAVILRFDPTSTSRSFVDTAPILEKAWAVKAGLGYIGRNSLLQHHQLGSFCFLGIIFTSAVFSSYNKPLIDSNTACTLSPNCSNCSLCVEACPTKAISISDSPRLNASKCLSYLTVEANELLSEVPKDLNFSVQHKKIKAFGCDICQEVCPCNSFSINNTPSSHPDFAPNSAIQLLNKFDIAKFDEASFKSTFSQSPIKRADLKTIKNNIDYIS